MNHWINGFGITSYLEKNKVRFPPHNISGNNLQMVYIFFKNVRVLRGKRSKIVCKLVVRKLLKHNTKGKMNK